jgi:hypothetical protein
MTLSLYLFDLTFAMIWMSFEFFSTSASSDFPLPPKRPGPTSNARGRGSGAAP